MADKQQVLDLHAEKPGWTASQIAYALGCDPAYVRATAQRNGLTMPVSSPAYRPTKAYLLREAALLRAKADRLEARAAEMSCGR